MPTKVAFLSPLPPARSGVAHYSSMLLPELSKHADVTAFGSEEGYRAGDYDVAVYQLGNNPHHEFVYREAMQNPGIAVLHDVVLHHLIVEMTLARGDAEAYVEALRANHGEAGAAWARGRAAGLHSEMGNFLFPASFEVARRSRAVIVHNRWAAGVLRAAGVLAHVVPHPYEAAPATGSVPHVIGFFGFLTSAKRAEVVLRAFRAARGRDSRLQLLIVGEPAPDIDVSSIAGEGVTMTGYVDDAEFARYYGAVDRIVNLRYPTAGETSGTLIRAFATRKPVAVSDYAQFAEFPDDCVTKIPLGDGEVEALTEFFLRDFDQAAVAAAQRQWLELNARIELTVKGYLEALRPSRHFLPKGGEKANIPLFPRLALAGVTFEDDAAVVTLRNDGDATVQTRVYGQPGYRVIAKLFDGARQIADHWLMLDQDVHPGATTELRVPLTGGTSAIRLYHALESIPIVEAVAIAEVEIARV